MFYYRMEYIVKDPYTVELAYRWYIATYKELLNDREPLRETVEHDEGHTVLHDRRINDEISASYHICMDSDTRELEIEYIIELFDNPRVSHTIPIFYEVCNFIQSESAVRARIQKFCEQTHYVCKCGQLAKPRLIHYTPNHSEHRCETCYLYWFKRTDDRCSICLEDEGVWVKLGCGHILHHHCWMRTPTTQCPVCRTLNECTSNIYKYPFFTTPVSKRK